MLPLMAVLFAVLDLSIAIFVKNTVQFAVCQGVRYAVTSQDHDRDGTGRIDQDAWCRDTRWGCSMYLSPDHVGRNRISITYYDPVSLSRR